MSEELEGEGFHARLFDASGRDQVLGLSDLANLAPFENDDQRLLWIDLQGPGISDLPEALDLLRIDAPDSGAAGTNPALGKQGDMFWLRVVAVAELGTGADVRGALLTLIATRNVVVSVHESALPFVDELREREGLDSRVGALSAESFVASLLDWQLTTYFDAIADFEMAVERLEVQILEARTGVCVPELRRLRRWASRLRRMLAPHRAVFAALARPDFQPYAEPAASRHLEALDGRFERAMDMVENARELVLGSFALFSTQTALQTNDSMKILTFVTVITGILATMVGALGMNFDASFFKSRDAGFWIATMGLFVTASAAFLLARWRKWI